MRLADVDPAIADADPLLQRLPLGHGQPQFVGAQMGDAQPAGVRVVRRKLGQGCGQRADAALADQAADVFAQAAIDDALGNHRLVGGVQVQAHFTTHFRSFRVASSCA
ncbi:hypothetical protein D3C78_1582640 [compost metagenome]